MSAILTYLVEFLVGYFGLTVGLYMLSLVLPRAGFVARILAAYMSLVVCALYGALASVVLRLAGHGQISQWATARAFKYVMAATTGIGFEVVDPDRTLDTLRPAVFIGNHQTELDVLMLGCMFPKYCSVTAKSSLRRVPFLGWFMSLSGSIFIDRKNAKDAREAMRGAADEIRQKRQSVYMFPEGTRSYAREPTLLPFKKGAFHLAVQAGVPIVPCVVANYSHILSIRGMVFRSGTVPVKGELLAFSSPPPPRPACYMLHKGGRLTYFSKSPRSDPDRWPQARGRRRAGPEHARADAEGAHQPHCPGAGRADADPRLARQEWHRESWRDGRQDVMKTATAAGGGRGDEDE